MTSSYDFTATASTGMSKRVHFGRQPPRAKVPGRLAVRGSDGGRKEPGKAKKPRRKAWDDTVTDLSVYKLSQQELEQRHTSIQSKNAEAARHDLYEKSTKSLGLDSSGNRRPSPGADMSGRVSTLQRALHGRELHEILAESDRSLAVVRDLFGDDPKRYIGQPNVTVAPHISSSRKELERTIQESHREGPSPTAMASPGGIRDESVRELAPRQLALNESSPPGLSGGEGSADEDTTLTPVSEEKDADTQHYQPSIDFQRFHAVIGTEEGGERAVLTRNATRSRDDRIGARHQCMVDQASQTNEEAGRRRVNVTRSQTGSPDLSDTNTDASRLTELSSIPVEAEGGAGQEQTVDSQASSVIMAPTGPPPHTQVAPHPLQLAHRVPLTRPIDTHDSREVGGSSLAARGGQGNESANHHRKRDDLQVLEEMVMDLDGQLEEYERQTGYSSPAQWPQPYQGGTFSSITASLLASMTKLAHYLQQGEAHLREETVVRSQLLQTMSEQQNLMDALTADIVKLRDEKQSLRAELEAVRRASEEQARKAEEEISDVRKKLESLSLPPPGGVYTTGVWLPHSGSPHLPPPVIGQAAPNPMNPLAYHHTRPTSITTQHPVAPPIPHPHLPLVTRGADGPTVPGGSTRQTSTTGHVTPEGYTIVNGAVHEDHLQPLGAQQSLPLAGCHGDMLFLPSFDLPKIHPMASSSELISRDKVAPGDIQLNTSSAMSSPPSHLHPSTSLDTVVSWTPTVSHTLSSAPALLADGSSTARVVYAQVSPFSHQVDQLDHSHGSSLLPSLDSGRHVHFAPKPQVKEMTPVHYSQSNYGLYSHAPWSSDALTHTRSLTYSGTSGSLGLSLPSPEAPSPPPLSIALQVPLPQAMTTTLDSGFKLASLHVSAPVSATSHITVAGAPGEKKALSMAWPVKDASLHVLSGADLSVESSLPEEDNHTSLKTAHSSPSSSFPATDRPSSPPFLDVRSSVERMSSLAKSVLQDISQQKELQTKLQQVPPPPAAFPDQLESASSKNSGKFIAASTNFSIPDSLPPKFPLKVTASSLTVPALSPANVSSLPTLHPPITTSKTAVVQRSLPRPTVVHGGWTSQLMPTQGGGATRPVVVKGGVAASQSVLTHGGGTTQPLLIQGSGVANAGLLTHSQPSPVGSFSLSSHLT